MAWRFKASKYKNAAPIVPKPEVCVRDICVGSYQTYGNNIAASAAFMAFNWEHAGSSLAVLPLDDCGRKSKTMPLLHGHTDTVTDLGFSPFHDGLLATASQDTLVKLWYIPERGLDASLTQPECTFSHKQRRVETVGFHPTADCLLHSTAAGSIQLWDLNAQQEVLASNEHPDVIQSLSWQPDGAQLATSCKDKAVRIVDPRAARPIQLTAGSHQSIKDSRVVWMGGDQQRILTTGFDAQRLRQIIIRDLRNFAVPEKTLELDCSTGILMPLYDPDTNMLFLAGKGDTTIAYMEVMDKEPHFVEGLRHNGEQTKGACLVPKRALRVMEGEVNRIMQLTSNSVIPIMYQVPRKTYRDFHADLYPETRGYRTELGAGQWLSGANVPVATMSLDPAKRELGEQPIIPRLGPKPFTSASGDVSFDKVFSVPTVPGAGSGDSVDEAPEELATDATGDNNRNNDDDDDVDDGDNNVRGNEEEDDEEIVLREKQSAETPDDYTNGDSSDLTESNSLEEDLQKAISTAERRKIFESNRSESDNSLNGDDKTGGESELRRMSLNRCSIADRRKLYESRSMSVQPDKPASPLPLTRKESLKLRSHSPKSTSPSSADIFKVPADVVDTNKKSATTAQLKKSPAVTEVTATAVAPTKRTSTVFGKVSKFRHLKGTPAHKSTHIENIRNISRQIPGECNGFQANHKRVAVPIAGPGGKIAVYELGRPGRLPDGVIPSLVNGANIMDFQWDPFDADVLAVAGDDGIVRLWRIPADGLQAPTNEPHAELAAHSDKIYFVRFHPLAKGVLLTASYDMSMKLWDIAGASGGIGSGSAAGVEKMCLTGHTDQIFDFAWSPCGVYGATVCKDGRVRVYNARKAEAPIREGAGPVGTRGARIAWTLEGGYLVCTGFDKVSERQISIYKASDLRAPLNTVGLDVSPAILQPFYDEDSSTLFVTGKGDSTIYAFEVTDEAPYICALSHHRCGSLHQGLSFLTKNHCDVSAVEFARALRLTNNTVEPLSFTVPRIKSELFQDDLFPPTTVTWTPTMTSDEWYTHKDKKPRKLSLQPAGMDSLSSVQPTIAPTPTKADSNAFSRHNSSNNHNADSAKSKQDEIQKALATRLEMNTKLEQDDMEGVADEEWTE